MTNREAQKWRTRAMDAEQALARACSDIVRLRHVLQQVAEAAELGRPLGEELAGAVSAEAAASRRPAGVCAWRGTAYRAGSMPASHGMCEACEACHEES